MTFNYVEQTKLDLIGKQLDLSHSQKQIKQRLAYC